MSVINTKQPITTASVPNRTEVKSDKPEQATMVERIVDKTYLGANYTASIVSGGVAGIGAFATSIPGAAIKTTGAVYSNLWKAETIGPNLKIIGSVVAAPVLAVSALVGLPVSAVAGMFHGGRAVDSSHPRQFTIGPAAQAGYGKTHSGWEKATEGLKSGLDELGSQKLKPGEKPIDIPIIKTGKALAVGAAAVAIGGVAGLVTAFVGTVRESVAGIGKAFSDENLSIPGKLIASTGAVLGGAIHGVTYGLATGVSIVGKGISETWKKDSLIEGGKEVLTHAGHSIAASANPKGTLLEEKKSS